MSYPFKVSVCLFLKAWLAIALISQAHSEEVVRFVSTTVEPWGYVTSSGKPDGLLARFVDQLGREAGLPYVNRLQPYPRVKHSLANGQADLAVLFSGPESERIGISLGAVVDTYIMLVGSAGMESIESLDDLQGKLVGYIRGSRYGPEFDNHEGIIKTPVNRMRQGVAMLLTGRLDAMASTDQTLFYTLRKMDVEVGRLSPLLVLGKTQGHLYLSRQSTNQHLAPIYRDALDKLRVSGKLDTLFYSEDRWDLEWYGQSDLPIPKPR